MPLTHPTKGSPEAKAWGAKMRALRKRRGPSQRVKRNAKGDYTGVLKLPSYIDRAVAFVLHDGPRVLDWEWDRRMSPENKKHFHDFLVSVHHPLAYEAGTPEQRFKRFVMEYVMPRIEKNPKGFHNIEKSGFHRGQYVGYGGGTWKISKYGTGERLWIAVKQGGGGEFYGASLSEISEKLTDLANKKNPGEAYHVKEAAEAHKIVRGTDDPDEKVFYAGVESAHRISASSAKRLGMNRPRTRRIPPQRRRGARKNPLAVFGVGNPPKRINTGIAGVVYSRCLEIKAEKTHYKPGLYRHPFSRKSGVEILALDNGDMLVHSTRGVNLWKPV